MCPREGASVPPGQERTRDRDLDHARTSAQRETTPGNQGVSSGFNYMGLIGGNRGPPVAAMTQPALLKGLPGRLPGLYFQSPDSTSCPFSFV